MTVTEAFPPAPAKAGCERLPPENLSRPGPIPRLEKPAVLGHTAPNSRDRSAGSNSVPQTMLTATSCGSAQEANGWNQTPDRLHWCMAPDFDGGGGDSLCGSVLQIRTLP